jgi:transcriptional regulator with GAF, ATPase, and Fis domain
MTSQWDQGWETRPLQVRPAISIPACTLTLPDGTQRRFTHRRITLGSAPDNDVVLADGTVSRTHAEILSYRDGYLVRDLDSTNGTVVNGVRIREGLLHGEARLELGSMVLGFAPDVDVVREEPSAQEGLGELVGCSPAMRRLFALIEQVATSDATVLIHGETGTGKEVVARTLHQRSRRAAAPLVVVDCSAIPEALLESELFGHEKGSFSGAIQTRRGLFELAHGGTLFLDEVGELPLSLQPKLLRALETAEIRRVGSSRSLRLDFRLLAATNRDLPGMVAAGTFRADLFYRLNVVPLYLPPLRERREDLSPLLHHFISRLLDDPAEGAALHRRLAAELADHPLPGNVRELLNLVARAVAAPTAPLRADAPAPPEGELEPAPASSRPLPPFKEAKEELVAEFEKDYLTLLMTAVRGNLSLAARRSGLDRKHLRELLRKHNLYLR